MGIDDDNDGLKKRMDDYDLSMRREDKLYCEQTKKIGEFMRGCGWVFDGKCNIPVPGCKPVRR